MKKLLIAFLLIPFISNAQIADTSLLNQKLQKASKEMIKFDKQFQSGAILEIIGGGLTVIGSGQHSQGLSIGGAVVALFGFIMNVSSSSHIKKAGLYLQGNSIVVPLHKH